MSDYSITANFFDYSYSRLRQDINNRLNSLRVILRAIETGVYKNLAIPQPNDFITFQASILENEDEKKEIELCNAFSDIIEYFNDFLDRIEALIKIYREPIILTRTLRGEDEIRNFVFAHVEEVIHNISKQKTFSPQKIDSYNLQPFSREASLQYFSIRNSITHHKRVADRDMQLIYKGLNLTLIKGDQEISILQPTRVEGGERIAIGYKEYRRDIQKGELISISEIDIQWVVATLGLIIAPDIINSANRLASS